MRECEGECVCEIRGGEKKGSDKSRKSSNKQAAYDVLENPG